MKLKTSCGTGALHTGANDCRCNGEGPCSRSAPRCGGCRIPYSTPDDTWGRPGPRRRSCGHAFDLRENRRGGDRGGECVAMNDRLLRKITIDPHGVDQKMVCCGRQLLHRKAHGEARRLIDVDLIDAGGIDGSDAQAMQCSRMAVRVLRGARRAEASNRAGRECGRRGQESRRQPRPAEERIRARLHRLRRQIAPRRPRLAFQISGCSAVFSADATWRRRPKFSSFGVLDLETWRGFRHRCSSASSPKKMWRSKREVEECVEAGLSPRWPGQAPSPHKRLALVLLFDFFQSAALPFSPRR